MTDRLHTDFLGNELSNIYATKMIWINPKQQF